jgi:predicted aspartyl protease
LKLSPIFGVVFFFAYCGANTQFATAQNGSAVAWKDCQSTDEDKRLSGCTVVIKADGFGSSSKLADALDGRCWAYHVKKQFARAIDDCKASIRIRPQYSYAYNNLGTAYVGLGDYEDAIKAFNVAVDLKPDFYWSRVKRAEAFVAVGRKKSAADDYEYLLKRDPNNQDLKGKLVALALTSDPKADVTLADQAQTQCIVADPTGTPLNVRTAPNGEIIGTIQNGVFVRPIDRSTDRNQKQWLYVSDQTGRRLGWAFQEFIRCPDTSTSVHRSDVAPAGSESIGMEREGGVYVIPVRFNDTITLNAIVDSGASDVSIPVDIVSTLIRTKTITDQDFLGQQTYILADGSKVPSQRFRIRSLKVGSITIENVVASIASVNGEILLGQSFLNRFKSWSVDNEQHTLILR